MSTQSNIPGLEPTVLIYQRYYKQSRWTKVTNESTYYVYLNGFCLATFRSSGNMHEYSYNFPKEEAHKYAKSVADILGLFITPVFGPPPDNTEE